MPGTSTDSRNSCVQDPACRPAHPFPAPSTQPLSATLRDAAIFSPDAALNNFGVPVATLLIAIVAAIAAVASTVFSGISLRMLGRQTRSLADQVELQIQQTGALTKQTELQAGQYEILASATELQFNLDVMV